MRASRLLFQLTTVLLASTISIHAIFAQAVPAMVVLVRHAEKATVGGADPSLSDLGQTRAKALATALADAGVTSVITTTFKRTVETGDVIAKLHNITGEKIAIAGTTASHVAAIAAAVRKHAGEVVLVVGHSNTIPAIVTALGGPKMADLCDSNYATMFVVHMSAVGKPAHVVRTRYGAAEAEGAETCSTPMKN